MTISAEEIAKAESTQMTDILEQARTLVAEPCEWRDVCKRDAHDPSTYCDCEKRAACILALAELNARIAALEAQLAESVTNEREECARTAESFYDSKTRVVRYCAGIEIARAIRARSEQEGK